MRARREGAMGPPALAGAVLGVLVVAVPVFADFTSHLYFDGSAGGEPLASSGTVAEGATVELVLSDEQTWTYPPPHPWNRMIWVQVNLDASTPALLPTLEAGTWEWEFFLHHLMDLEVDDSLAPDLMVKRTDVGTWPPLGMDGPLHELGTLTFIAPAYDPAGDNTYAVSLAGGVYDEDLRICTITILVGVDEGEFAGLRWGTLTVEDFEFTVTPEPATLALLAVGGLLLLHRRK